MPFIDLPGLNDVKEPEVAPEGDYEMVIEAADLMPSKKEGAPKDAQNIRLRVAFADDPQFAPVFHYISLPNSEDDDDKRVMKLRMAKEFLVHFGVDFDEGLEPEAMPGCHALTHVTVEVDDKERESNRLMLPRFSNE